MTIRINYSSPRKRRLEGSNPQPNPRNQIYKTYPEVDANYHQLVNYLNSAKRILLLGNAISYQESDHSKFINMFDCVIRINRGVPTVNTGSRTDVWVCMLPWDEALEDAPKFDPRFIIRFPITKTSFLWHESLSRNLVRVNISKEHKTFFHRGHLKPGEEGVRIDSSTGAKVIDFLTHQLGLDITIAGFDFFNTGTFYRPDGIKYCKCHVPSIEEDYILNNPKVTYIDHREAKDDN